MRLAGFQKLTLLDFPGKAACTVFTPGCNFRCPFCHNAGLASSQAVQEVSQEDVFSFLQHRRGLLDGLCLTGGEPTLQEGLAAFCRRVKALSFSLKLDTNGSRPDVLSQLIEEGLVDYVAMDVKNGPSRYAQTAGVPGLDLGPIRESVVLLKQGRVPYEFRTTVVASLHDEASLLEAAEWLRGAQAWFLQQFVDSGGCFLNGLTAYSEEALRALAETVRPIVPSVCVRGI